MQTLLIERTDGVVTVTLNRPEKKNAINKVMWEELTTTFREIAGRRDDRAVVITGAGGAFCSGADLTDLDRRDEHFLNFMRRVGDACAAVHRLEQPVIAKVGGIAAGAGFGLAVASDLIIASEEARFSTIFSRRGLTIDFGTSWALPRLVGMHRAKELALLAEIIDAAEAERMGLVNRVVPVSDLDKTVGELASRLAAGPPLALSMTKRLLNQSAMVGIEQALEAEAMAQSVNIGTADTAEAVAAFIEKREPEFKGH